MKEIFRVIEPPRQCAYLHAERASLEIRVIESLSPHEYGELLARGYRRFGNQFFRPACPNCSACRSLRVLLPNFRPTSSQRRVLRQNEGIRAELHPVYVTPAHVELINRYQRFMHRHRGWQLQKYDLGSYHAGFVDGSDALGRQWLYFEENKLIGVALMDEAPGAISLVYFFYEPNWRERSPGTFSILNQLLYAQYHGLTYAYLGYCVQACQSLHYKSRFRPYELLREYVGAHELPQWQSAVM